MSQIPHHAEDDPDQLRASMVRQQLCQRDIRDESVLQVMQKVPRHEFVPDQSVREAYADKPLAIGDGQTISQPYIVALTTQLVRPLPTDRALDIGTGSGYQAAVLAELSGQVHSIETIGLLASQARTRLQRLGYDDTITVHHADGSQGWPSAAPFDIIVAAAAPESVPPALLQQLGNGGRLAIPVGKTQQVLMLFEKDKSGAITQTEVTRVAFVPMIVGTGTDHNHAEHDAT